MKVVINRRFGGFGLSDQARQLYAETKGIDPEEVYDWEIERDDADLIRIVEQLGKQADGRCADLKVVEIPDGVKWYVHEYDGLEDVREGRIWS